MLIFGALVVFSRAGFYLSCLNVQGFESLNKTRFDCFSNNEVLNPSNFSNGEAFIPSNSEATTNQTMKSLNIFNRIPINSRFSITMARETPRRSWQKSIDTLLIPPFNIFH
jgi:hypothetical protein